MSADPALQAAVGDARACLTDFARIVGQLSEAWVPHSEVDALRDTVRRLTVERDGWKRQYETLNGSLVRPVDMPNGPVRSPVLEVPYSLQVGNNSRNKLQPVAGGQIVMDCITLNHNTLHWNRRPTSVLLVKKPHVEHITSVLHDMATWLCKLQRLEVFLLEETLHELQALGHPTGPFQEHHPSAQVDFAISLGGDGTMLYLANLFATAVPPIVPFAMGSLGFLTPFPHGNYKAVLTQFIEKGQPLSIRNRLDCTVRKQDQSVRHEVVMNEVVVDRGTSDNLTHLDCYVNDLFCTAVQGDGCIISTPTGSTAYSLSAGGSICHPQVPCMILTPISPHSLSFRPVVFQHSIHFKITLSEDARDNAWVSFDGRHRVQLEQGDELLVQHSRYPVPVVCAQDETEDWLRSVTAGLRWNQRDRQQPWPPPRLAPVGPPRTPTEDPLEIVRRRRLRYVPPTGAEGRLFRVAAEGQAPGTPPATPLGSFDTIGDLDTPLRASPRPFLTAGSLQYTASFDSVDSIAAKLEARATSERDASPTTPDPFRNPLRH